MRKIVILLASAAVWMAANSYGSAGGLFGEGGVIRGDVGRAMQPFQQRVLTPAIRKEVENQAAAAGAYGGGYVAGPYGAVGGAIVGRSTGRWVNNCFAGRCYWQWVDR